MSPQTKKTMRLIYTSLLSVMLVITGVLLMAACVNVYAIGDRPFTPENIAREFAKIAPVAWVTLALLAVGAFLALGLPEEKKKLRATVNQKAILDRLLQSVPVSDMTGEGANALKREVRLCKTLRIVAVALVLVAAAPALAFSLNLNNFSADYNQSVIAACTLILPMAFLGMGVAVAYLFLAAASIDRQIALVKREMANAGGKVKVSRKIATQQKMRPEAVMGIRVFVATLALLCIILGICNGGVADVLSKAINICTECIGLG